MWRAPLLYFLFSRNSPSRKPKCQHCSSYNPPPVLRSILYSNSRALCDPLYSNRSNHLHRNISASKKKTLNKKTICRFSTRKQYFRLHIIPHESLISFGISLHGFPQIVSETLFEFTFVDGCCDSHGQFYYENDGEAYCKLLNTTW